MGLPSWPLRFRAHPGSGHGEDFRPHRERHSSQAGSAPRESLRPAIVPRESNRAISPWSRLVSLVHETHSRPRDSTIEPASEWPHLTLRPTRHDMSGQSHPGPRTPTLRVTPTHGPCRLPG